MSTATDSELRAQSRAFVTLLERQTVLGQLPGTLKAPPYAGVPMPVDDSVPLFPNIRPMGGTILGVPTTRS